MRMAQIAKRRVTLREFERMLESGRLPEDVRLELLEGRIVRMSPHSDPHVMGICRSFAALRRVFGSKHFVRQQLPLAIPGLESRPEPDLAVVTGEPDSWARAVPDSALLVVEVSAASPRRDRRKARSYACGLIQDYWIVNARDRVLEVHRGPISSGRRSRFESVQIFGPDDSIAPLAAPRRTVRVKDLLP